MTLLGLVWFGLANGVPASESNFMPASGYTSVTSGPVMWGSCRQSLVRRRKMRGYVIQYVHVHVCTLQYTSTYLLSIMVSSKSLQ